MSHAGAGFRRHLRTIRDEDHVGLLKSVCFLPAAGVMALGSHVGELRLYDVNSGELATGADDHSAAVNLLRSWQVCDRLCPSACRLCDMPHVGGSVSSSTCLQSHDGSKSLLLSSSRQEVKLWDVASLESGPVTTWEVCRGGHFDHAGTRAAAVAGPARCACCAAPR